MVYLSAAKAALPGKQAYVAVIVIFGWIVYSGLYVKKTAIGVGAKKVNGQNG